HTRLVIAGWCGVLFTRRRGDAEIFLGIVFAQRRRERRGVAPAAKPREIKTPAMAATFEWMECACGAHDISALSASLREKTSASPRLRVNPSRLACSHSDGAAFRPALSSSAPAARAAGPSRR